MYKLRSILIILVIMAISNVRSFSQHYHKVKVTKTDGFTLEGKNAEINNETVTFEEGAMIQTYSLNDILYIQAKQGKAKKWAVGCGSSCLGLTLMGSIVATNVLNSSTDGYYTDNSGPNPIIGMVASSLFYSGVSAGVGAIIGTLLDNYEMIYVRPASSELLRDRIEINLSSTQHSSYNLAITYRF